MDDTFIILFCEKPNFFQKYFVTIHYFCSNITNEIVVQIGTPRRSTHGPGGVTDGGPLSLTPGGIDGNYWVITLFSLW